MAGQVGLLLGWRPNEFWGATPAEVAAVLGAVAGGEPAGVSADEVSRLRALFPD
ncbi:MAG TPA: phage tail assembly chaperone [Allosphingosinicella sp.]